MRGMLQDEETSGEENASGGVSRTRKRQECPLGEVPGGACYGTTLQEKEAPGKAIVLEDSMRWGSIRRF